MERFASIKDDMSQWSCSSAELQDMQVMFEFIQNFEKLSDQVYENIRILQEYRELPFQIYERSHVLDRYISEMTSIINNFLGYFSYWLTTNAHRYKQYVEAIILVINTIRSYQVLIDFSANWSEKCSTCSVDNYDQYMCKFSTLFSKFDAFKFIQIPNFKLPNITLDFSDIKL
ncbi:MAG: hypothetical protein K6E76_05585 [Patescibacteria group bacterium]|nr:hypothetical protein [Patescibacteria group bacterium]